MSLQEIDWNECWRVAQGKKDIPKRDPEFWNRRAPSFARNVLGSDYIGQFLDIIKPVPDWTVLDIGCAAGTLAVPLAPLVKSITAMDPSTRMLSLLEDRCREHGITNIRILEGGWEDDWDALDVGIHDVAIASRSLVVEDLRGAILKLENRARKRVYLSTLVDDGPHDRRIVEATGRRFQEGPDYILVYNLLRSMGIHANVAFTVHREEKIYSDVEDALSAMSWMIHGMTPEEEDRLRRYLRQNLVEHNGRWKLPYQRIVRWAVLWWEKVEQEGRQ